MTTDQATARPHNTGHAPPTRSTAIVAGALATDATTQRTLVHVQLSRTELRRRPPQEETRLVRHVKAAPKRVVGSHPVGAEQPA